MEETKSINSIAMTNAEIVRKRLPKGTSEYQAAWYPSDDSDLVSLDSEVEEEIKEMDELDEARVAYSEVDDMSIDVEDDWNEDLETKTNQSIKEIEEEMEDEVNLELNEKAREKFKYYR